MSSDAASFKELPGDDRVVQPGSLILREGEGSDTMFLVKEGMGLRYKTLPDGERQVLGFMVPGDVVGLQAGLDGHVSHSAEATTAMHLRATNKRTVIHTFSANVEQAVALARAAVQEERALGEALTTVGQREALARVAWLMCKLHERLTLAGLNKNGSVPLPFRQQDIADALGLSLVHTNKTLAKLKRDGIARWAGKRLVIDDFDALQSLLDGAEMKAA